MSSDIGFAISTAGMFLGTVGIIAIGKGERQKNESLKNTGNLALMLGGLILLCGLSIK